MAKKDNIASTQCYSRTSNINITINGRINIPTNKTIKRISLFPVTHHKKIGISTAPKINNAIHLTTGTAKP